MSKEEPLLLWVMEDHPHPTRQEIEQRLRLIDFRLNQRYPGYLDMLEQLRKPSPCYQDGEWSPVRELWHTWQKKHE